MTEAQLNEIRQQLAAVIVGRRKALGLTQEQLAEKSGVGIATIKRFESDSSWLNLKQYILLRDALQLPTSL